MKLALLLIAATLLATSPDHASCAHHHAPAPAPSVDCSSLILNMADCLSYVSSGSTTTVPEKTCCSGLKTVLAAAPGCLCEGLKSSAQLGVVLNVTKAVTLPAACKLTSPPLASCGLSLLAPAAAPATLSGGGEQAPAQSPGNSGSFLVKASLINFLFTIFVAVGALL